MSFLQPWGFDVGTISVPVLVRYGLTDVLVPPAHGEWLAANVPGCVVAVEDAGGHLGMDPEEEIAANVRWLSDGIAPDGARPRRRPPASLTAPPRTHDPTAEGEQQLSRRGVRLVDLGANVTPVPLTDSGQNRGE